MTAAKTQLTAEALKAAGPADDVKSEKSAKTATSSLKRKRGNDHKFYAVKAGKTPEIYHSWTDCIDQVKGFPGAICMYINNYSMEVPTNSSSQTSRSHL
jgi:Caulimovirus viroplasmin